jgi:hypothetical protein
VSATITAPCHTVYLASAPAARANAAAARAGRLWIRYNSLPHAGKKKTAAASTSAVPTSGSGAMSGDPDAPIALSEVAPFEAPIEALLESAEPSFNALIAPFNEPVVTVKVEKIEPVVKVEKIVPVAKAEKIKPPIVRQKAERERPTPPMVPRVPLPQEWVKSLCDEVPEEIETVEPITPLFTPSDVSIPLLVAVLCTGYAAWRVSRSFTADTPAAPAIVPQVSM